MRQNRLCEMEQLIVQRRVVSLEELAAKYGVSMNTIRRDVAELIAMGKVRKVYGGVSALEEKAPTSIDERIGRNTAAKEAIGELAATLIPARSTVYLDTGSTTMQAVRHLAAKPRITLVTPSLNVINEARKFDSLNVIMLGGLYNHSTGSCVGSSVTDALSGMRMDYVLMAATGVSIESGVTNSTYAEVEIKRLVASRGANVILMTDHTKICHAALMKFCDIKDLSVIVTDQRPPQRFMDYCEEMNVKVLWPDQQ